MLPWKSYGSQAADNCTDQAAAMTFSDTVFGFLGSGHGYAESSCTTTTCNNGGYIDSMEAEQLETTHEEESWASSIEQQNKVFWDNQHRALKETLCKSSYMERTIRNAAKEATKAAQAQGYLCVCERTPEEGCRRCLMNDISRRLRQASYDSAVCNSKWRSSPEIPSGEHTFIDVLDNSNPKKGQVRVIIELSFKAEFEMARARDEYKKIGSSSSGGICKESG